MKITISEVTPEEMGLILGAIKAAGKKDTFSGIENIGPEQIEAALNKYAPPAQPPEPQKTEEPGADILATAPAPDVFNRPASTPAPVQVPIPGRPVNTTQQELDSEGMPWDVRIHSSARSKIQNGTWKLRRGAAPNLVEQVKAEYAGGVKEPVPQQPAETSPAAPPEPAQIPTIVTREMIHSLVVKGIGEGAFKPARVLELLQGFGVQNLDDLINHVDKFDDIHKAIQALYDHETD